MSLKPSLDEVLEYGETQFGYYMRLYAMNAAAEHKEEMLQDARERLVGAYEKLEGDKGWKTFVQQHVFGAVMDYLRRGRGFEETNWSLSEERAGSEPIRFREDGPSEADDEHDVDRIAGLNGISADLQSDDGLNIRWDLLARLCSADHDLHIFVRHFLLSNSLTELTGMFGVTRERLGQRLTNFISRFDDPHHAQSPWLLQTIYALGLCERFGLAEVDQKLGWHFEPVSFERIDKSKMKKPSEQLALFDQH